MLRNRIVSTAHAEVIADEHGLPGERHLRYYEEKAKGGLGWPSAAAPASFRPTARKAGGARSTFHRPRHRTAGPPGRGHAPPRRAHHDPGDPHGPALVLAWRTLAAPGQPVRRARARAPGQRQDHRARGNPPHHRRLRGGGAPRAGGRHGRHRDIRRPPAPDRPVLEPAHQLPHRRVRRLSGEPPALRHAGAAGGARGRRQGFLRGPAHVRRRIPRGRPEPRHAQGNRPGHGRDQPDRLPQRDRLGRRHAQHAGQLYAADGAAAGALRAPVGGHQIGGEDPRHARAEHSRRQPG